MPWDYTTSVLGASYTFQFRRQKVSPLGNHTYHSTDHDLLPDIDIQLQQLTKRHCGDQSRDPSPNTTLPSLIGTNTWGYGAFTNRTSHYVGTSINGKCAQKGEQKPTNTDFCQAGVCNFGQGYFPNHQLVA